MLFKKDAAQPLVLNETSLISTGQINETERALLTSRNPIPLGFLKEWCLYAGSLRRQIKARPMIYSLCYQSFTQSPTWNVSSPVSHRTTVHISPAPWTALIRCVRCWLGRRSRHKPFVYSVSSLLGTLNWDTEVRGGRGGRIRSSAFDAPVFQVQLWLV